MAHCHAKPVFVDIDPETWTMNSDLRNGTDVCGKVLYQFIWTRDGGHGPDQRRRAASF
jgi:hypothetical protein